MTFLISFLAYLPKIIFGFSIVHLIWNDIKPSSIFLKLSIASPLGIGITTFFLFAWKLFGLDHVSYIFFEISIVLIVLVMMLLVHHNAFKSIKIHIPKPSSLIDKLLLITLFISVVISVGSYLLIVLTHPHGREDAWSNWNLIARFIYGSDNMSNALDYLASSTFPGYPFMLGLAVANGWIFIGEVSTRVPIIVSALFTYSIPGILFFALLKIKGFRVACIATILVCSPWLANFGSFLMSDIPLAVFYLISGIFIALYLHSSHSKMLIFVGLAAGLATWTKNDGIPFVFVITIVIVFIAIQRKENKVFSDFILGLILPLTMVGIYKIFLAESGNIVSTESTTLLRLADFSRFQIVLNHFAKTTSSYGDSPIGYFWVLFLLTLIIGINIRRLSTYYLFFIVIFQYSIYFAVYMITPLDLQWHLNTSMFRVLTHLAPLCTFSVFYSLRKIPPLPISGR